MQKTTPITRARIQALVRADPGIHIRRIAFLSGLSWNTVQYHLRRMEADGTVVSRKVQGNVCYFDRASGAFHGKQGQALLREPRNVLLARHLIDNGGRSQRELAEELGLAASVVHRRIQKFEEAGLVERIPEGRSVLVFPREDLTLGLSRAGLLPRGGVDVDIRVPVPAEVVEDAVEQEAPGTAATAGIA